jgi:dTDP-4-amino-4,6-dideoxygalactose transaminase
LPLPGPYRRSAPSAGSFGERAEKRASDQYAPPLPAAAPPAPAFRRLRHRSGAFPVSERLASEVLSLPMFPGIREDQLGAVVAAIADYFQGR